MEAHVVVFAYVCGPGQTPAPIMIEQPTALFKPPPAVTTKEVNEVDREPVPPDAQETTRSDAPSSRAFRALMRHDVTSLGSNVVNWPSTSSVVVIQVVGFIPVEPSIHLRDGESDDLLAQAPPEKKSRKKKRGRSAEVVAGLAYHP